MHIWNVSVSDFQHLEMHDTLATRRVCWHVSKASPITEHTNHLIKPNGTWGCSCVLLTELGVGHQVSQSSSGGVGIQGCVCSGVYEGPPSRVGRGGRRRRRGGRTLDDSIKPVLNGWVAVTLVGGGGGKASLSAQRALVFWCWRCVCVWQVGNITTVDKHTELSTESTPNTINRTYKTFF